MTTPNIPQQSVNAWIYLDEDDPAHTGYTSPNSSYQSLVNNNVYKSMDMLNICFFITVPDGQGYWTIEIGNKNKVHPDGSTTEQYLQYTIRDSRAQNPNMQILATLSYNTNILSQIFSKDQSQWPNDTAKFAANVKAYLIANQMNGLDIDWEGAYSTAISKAQFIMLFTAIRQAFNSGTSSYFYLTLSPASVGNLDVNTVNTCFDFINLQLYSGFTFASDYTSIGINPDMLAYGSKFESEFQNADQAYDGMNAGFKVGNTQYTYQITTQWRLNSNNYEYEQSQQILLYQFVYGITNSSFNDIPIIANAGNPPITQLLINSGEVLDALQATNTSSANVVFGLLQHGGNGGNPSTITLAPGDLITQMTGYTGVWFGWNCVLQVTFKTKNGKTYGPFGTMSNSSSKTPFSYVAPQGQSLVAFSGSTILVPEAGGGESFVISELNVSFA